MTLNDTLARLFDPNVNLADFASENGLPVVRVVHRWGHGQWHCLKDESRISKLCLQLDRRYPGGKHRVEYREVTTLRGDF